MSGNASRVPDDAIVGAIEGFRAKRGYSPSLCELADMVGLRPGSIHARVARLRCRGRVTYRDGRTRTLEVVK